MTGMCFIAAESMARNPSTMSMAYMPADHGFAKAVHEGEGDPRVVADDDKVAESGKDDKHINEIVVGEARDAGESEITMGMIEDDPMLQEGMSIERWS